ncbi:MAG: hypothetical protein AAF380_02415 [Bacteroidota bacterium]
MKTKPWFKKIPLDIVYFDRQIAIEMKVDDSYIKELILQLMALSEGLVNEFTIKPANFSLKITMNKKLKSADSICTLLNKDENYAHFTFSQHELECLRYFLLQCYMGKYDKHGHCGHCIHTDIELYLHGQHEPYREITFMVQKIYWQSSHV